MPTALPQGYAKRSVAVPVILACKWRQFVVPHQKGELVCLVGPSDKATLADCRFAGSNFWQYNLRRCAEHPFAGFHLYAGHQMECPIPLLSIHRSEAPGSWLLITDSWLLFIDQWYLTPDYCSLFIDQWYLTPDYCSLFIDQWYLTPVYWSVISASSWT